MNSQGVMPVLHNTGETPQASDSVPRIPFLPSATRPYLTLPPKCNPAKQCLACLAFTLLGYAHSLHFCAIFSGAEVMDFRVKDGSLCIWKEDRLVSPVWQRKTCFFTPSDTEIPITPGVDLLGCRALIGGRWWGGPLKMPRLRFWGQLRAPDRPACCIPSFPTPTPFLSLFVFSAR